MSENEIVEEVHRIREKLWKKYGGTMESFMAEMRRQAEEARKAGVKVVSCPGQKVASESRKVGGGKVRGGWRGGKKVRKA